MKTQNNLIVQNSNSEKSTFKMDLKKILTLSLILIVLIAYVTFSAFIGGNLNVKKINITSNMLQTRIVQSKLYDLGYYSGKIDGLFDEDTISAVK